MPYEVRWSCGHWARLNALCTTTAWSQWDKSSYYGMTLEQAHHELARRTPRCLCRIGT
jgi:hypothetical protein